jgi:hypothetical protein
MHLVKIETLSWNSVFSKRNFKEKTKKKKKRKTDYLNAISNGGPSTYCQVGYLIASSNGGFPLTAWNGSYNFYRQFKWWLSAISANFLLILLFFC